MKSIMRVKQAGRLVKTLYAELFWYEAVSGVWFDPRPVRLVRMNVWRR